MRSLGIRGLLVPLVIAILGLSPNTVQRVPLFAQFATEDPALRTYSAPLHVSVAIHKLITFHFGLDGMVYFRPPGRLAMTMQRVPDQYQKLFAKLGPAAEPVKATWFLRDGGTIASTIESTIVGGYVVPKVQHADITPAASRFMPT